MQSSFLNVPCWTLEKRLVSRGISCVFRLRIPRNFDISCRNSARIDTPEHLSLLEIIVRNTAFTFAALIFLSSLGSYAFAQNSNWVDFSDQRSRMMFNTNDGEEKDLVAGDVDRDGDTDVLVVRKVPFSTPGGRPNLLLMNEDGNLVDRTADFIPAFANADDDRDVLLFDANNDGWLDIVTVTTFSDTPRLYMNQGNDANFNWQGFQDTPNWYTPAFPVGPKFCGVAAGDVNDDGFQDLFFVDYDNSLQNRLLMNNGDGTFTDETDTRLSPDASIVGFGTGAFITDFNYDGFNDIVSLESTVEGGGGAEGRGIEFCVNDGTGNFNVVQVLPSNLTYMMDLADFNNDGRDDLYVVSDVQDYIIFNDSTNSDGTIETTVQSITSSSITSGFSGNVHAADVDNDGFLDMAVCDVDVDIPGCTRRFALLRNNNGNGLSDPNNGVNPIGFNYQGSHDMCWIDINNDGNLDMFMATCFNYHLLINDAPAVFTVPSSVTTFRGIGIVESNSRVASSDDIYASYNPGFIVNVTEAPVWLVFDATAPNATEFSIESKTNTPSLEYSVEAFNWATGSYDLLDMQPGSFGSDATTTTAIVPADHVNSNGEVRTRVGWRVTGFTIVFPWQVDVDQAQWQ